MDTYEFLKSLREVVLSRDDLYVSTETNEKGRWFCAVNLGPGIPKEASAEGIKKLNETIASMEAERAKDA